ncbi:hypothetical protein V3W47_09510 [Deinococcus sp. YIM 134068]|uniref:hypothetical protein n=1 Tax=Deinococcus lichenicola TaxID=3118910 RepID=UPI002F942291
MRHPLALLTALLVLAPLSAPAHASPAPRLETTSPTTPPVQTQGDDQKGGHGMG